MCRLRESKEQSDELLVELQAVRREWEAETHQLREELTRLTSEENNSVLCHNITLPLS